jgi:uncharacterized damage-inducible protein DinB
MLTPTPTPTEHAILIDELRRAWDGQPWHGSPVAEILAGIPAARAAARPLPAAHTIWEIALHLTAWTREVERRLRGEVPGMPAEGDWPRPGEAGGEPAWKQACEDLGTAHRELLAAVEGFPAERLSEPVGGLTYVAELGTGITHAVMLHGLAQHHAYHAGQIALLRKASSAG